MNPSRRLFYEKVADRLPVDEFRLYMPEHMALPRKRNHGQCFFERNPAKFAVLMIDDNGRLGSTKPTKTGSKLIASRSAS